jgi:hypothetical protein
MSTALTVTAILGVTVPTLVALAGLLRWVYRRGEASGAEKARREADERSQAEDKAKIAALERLLVETRVELAQMRTELPSRQPKHRRALRLSE